MRADSPVTLTLPYPVSANRYWQSRIVTPRGGKPFVTTYVTAEAKQYKESVAWLARSAGIRQPIVGRVATVLELYPHRPLDWKKRMRDHGDLWDDTVQCIDLGNAEKVLHDALKDVVFGDDKFLHDIHLKRMEPDGRDACVVVTIRPYSRTSVAQLDLLPKAIQAPPPPRQPVLAPIYADDGSTLPF